MEMKASAFLYRLGEKQRPSEIYKRGHYYRLDSVLGRKNGEATALFGFND